MWNATRIHLCGAGVNEILFHEILFQNTLQALNIIATFDLLVNGAFKRLLCGL
jgi:hypothetical protein